MPDTIEQAKSGRAKCRKCREKIEKDTVRFGHEVEGDFGTALQWYHLPCAAEKVPVNLERALLDYAGDVPDRAALEEGIAGNRSKQKSTRLPYAELAPSGRSSCIVCGEKIEKDELRVAVEREIEAGGFTRTGAGYLHPKCAANYEDAPADLTDQVVANSMSLDETQCARIRELLS